MRRAEMARRRRNLSEKRNEEVKVGLYPEDSSGQEPPLTRILQMETINKLLKKQAPKTKGRAQLAGDEKANGAEQRAQPMFVRWISNKTGSIVAVPDEMLEGPAGDVFKPEGLKRGRMVEEVS
jgi:Ino eighty subunit 2